MGMKITLELGNARDFWFTDETDKTYYHVIEGNGTNLDAEDAENGYVDYIYYDVYTSLYDVKNDCIYDGGIVMLKEYYGEHTVREIIEMVTDMVGTNIDEIKIKEL